MRIKKWKLFLESNLGDEESKKLKENLMKSFEELFLVEAFVRPIIKASGDTSELEGIADQIIEGLGQGIIQGLQNENRIPGEIKPQIASKLSELLVKHRSTMVEESFKLGLENVIDEYVVFIAGLRNELEKQANLGLDSEGDSEKDYSEMSKSEIQDLIDKALDDKDFKEVAKLSKYLKESVQEKEIMTDDIEEILNKMSEKVIKAIVEYLA